MNEPSLSKLGHAAGEPGIRWFSPSCSYSPTLLPIVFLFGAFLYCFSFVRSSPLNPFDEGYAVYGASRILMGDVPYRDFFVVYPPGQFYLLAGIFKLFGSAILVERILDIFVRLSISAAIFLISARLTAIRFAVVPWMIAIAWLGAAGFHGYAVFPALLFSLISIYCLLLYSSNRRAFLLPIIGINVGLATLFRVDVGMYTFLAQAPSLAFLASQHSKQVIRPGASPFIPSLKAGAYFVAGVLLPLLPMFSYLMAQASPQAVWGAVFIIPATRLDEVRRLPFPPLFPTLTNHDGASYADTLSSYLQFPFLFYCPLLIYGLSALLVSASFFRWSPVPRDRGSSFYLGGSA